jgi:NAD(P)-dependent dehydrogenase (short-subunit alcohol dehydrogenase family)
MNPSLRAGNMPRTPVDLTGQTAIVTGSNTGLGEQAAVALAAAGAHVVLACRGMDKAEAVAAAINSSCKGSAEALSLGACARANATLRWVGGPAEEVARSP